MSSSERNYDLATCRDIGISTSWSHKGYNWGPLHDGWWFVHWSPRLFHCLSPTTTLKVSTCRLIEISISPSRASHHRIKRKQTGCASFEAEQPRASEIPCLSNSIPLKQLETQLATMAKLMTNLRSFLLLSLFSRFGDCCSSAALASPILAGAGAIGSIVSGFGAGRDLFYPVDIYPSSCKRNHWQVCIS